MSDKTVPSCVGCGGGLSIAEISFAFHDNHYICMKCVHARHKAVIAGHCVCPKKERKPTGPLGNKSRQWIGCERCLGVITQLKAASAK